MSQKKWIALDGHFSQIDVAKLPICLSSVLFYLSIFEGCLEGRNSC
jgi:hypothetical protein